MLPKPAHSRLQVGEFLYNKNGDIVRHISPSTGAEVRKYDPDHIVDLCLEVIPDGSVLVFCHSKQSCQTTAEMLARHFPEHIYEHQVALPHRPVADCCRK